MEALKPYIKVTYNGTDISEDISKSLCQFVYTDSMDEADTIDLTVEDVELKWQNEWYPDKGARLVCEIGIEGGVLLNCGTFEIDDIEFSGPPDQVTIKGIAAGFKGGKKRSEKSHTHESKTLAEIVKTIAGNAGLTVQGEIGNIKLGRSVQAAQRDMRYLRRLANEYGYTFNIRGTVLNFFKRKDLEGATTTGSYDKHEAITYKFSDKSTGIYKAVQVNFHNPETGELITHTEEDPAISFTDDIHVVNCKAENTEQAKAIAAATLNLLNKLQQSGNITFEGNPYLVAGNVIELTGFGKASGNYIIKSSSHTVGVAEGWIVDLEVYKVGFIPEAKNKPQKSKKKKKAEAYSGPMAAGDKDLFNY